MIIDCIADLHGERPNLNEGAAMLIIAGDLCARDGEEHYYDFWQWIINLPYEHVAVIAGNHDNFLQKEPRFFPNSVNNNIHYLCDSGCEIDGFKIWGSPWTKTFKGMNPKCKAFTCDTDEELAEKWEMIPYDTDILVTHSPSWGNLDITTRGESVGSLSLWMKILGVMPRIHICGHIHESYGECTHRNGIKIVNASLMNEDYDFINEPIRIEI